MARCLRVGVLPDCSNHPFPINPTAAPVLFRPAKLPDIRTLLASCLNDTSVLHGLPPACRDGGSSPFRSPKRPEFLSQALGQFFLLIVTSGSQDTDAHGSPSEHHPQKDCGHEV